MEHNLIATICRPIRLLYAKFWNLIEGGHRHNLVDIQIESNLGANFFVVEQFQANQMGGGNKWSNGKGIISG